MRGLFLILFAVLVAVVFFGCSSEDQAKHTILGASGTTTEEGVIAGACCLPDGSCLVLEEADCLQLGGEFHGDIGECDPNPCEQTSQYEGCGLGWWKNHDDAWEMTAYMPGDLLAGVFTIPEELELSADDTLYDGLRHPGGNGASGGARLLLRTAVVALLNASHPDVNFPLTEAEIIQIVDGALATMDRNAMQDARHEIDMHNSQGCPLE